MRKSKNKQQIIQGASPVKPVSPSPAVFRISPNALTRQESTPSQRNWAEGTIIYGQDDALPLRIAQAVEESPAASSCIDTIAQFIKGSSFSEPDLMTLVIDAQGTKLWDLHCSLAEALATFNGFSVNLKWNRGAKITSAYYTPFESCRFAEPADGSSEINLIKYNPYFGTSENKKQFTREYPVFKNIKDTIEIISNLDRKKEAEWGGQIYYYGKTSPLHRFYPVPKYWSAKEAIQSDHKLQEFNNEELDNGFFQSVLINAIGDPNKPSNNPAYMKQVKAQDGSTKYVPDHGPDGTVGKEFNDQMQSNFSGSKKAGTAMVLWSTNSDTAVKIQSFPVVSNGDRLIATRDSITKTITIATKVPSILANISEGVSLGSGGSEIQKAVELMQSRTSEWRTILENFYNTVLLPNLDKRVGDLKVSIQNFNPVSEKVEIEDKFWDQFTSKEKREFVKKLYPQANLQDVSEDSAPSQRTLIEVIGVGGSQALLAILTQYADGKLTETQTSNTLQILFGISPVDAARIIQKNPVSTTTETTETVIPDQGITQQPQQTDPNQEAIDALIRSLKRSDLSKLYGYVNDYRNGRATFEQTKIFLKAFKLNDDQIDLFLKDPEGDGI